MTETGGNGLPLAGSAAVADDLGQAETAFIATEDQHRAPGPVSSGIGELAIRDQLSGGLTASQARANKLLRSIQRIPVALRAGGVALWGSGAAAANTTSRTFSRAVISVYHAPESAVTSVAAATMTIATLLVGGNWDARRDRLENYFISPDSPYIPPPPAPEPVYRPIHRPVIYSKSPANSEFPNWFNSLLAASQAAPSMRRPAQPNQHGTVLASPILFQQQPAPQLSVRPVAAQPESAAASLRQEPAKQPSGAPRERQRYGSRPYRLIRVLEGNQEWYIHGSAESAYESLQKLMRKHPNAQVLSDTPFTPWSPLATP